MKATTTFIITLFAAALSAGAAPTLEAVPSGASGFLYGTVTTEGGNAYTGTLRWGTEESFWGDLFNSDKERLPYWRDVPRREREHRDRGAVKIFGIRVGYTDGDADQSRVFVVRFGDIDRIEPHGDGDAVVVLKGGERLRVSGGANDVEATILVRDPSLGEVSLDWDKIASIVFAPVPPETAAPDGRLYGTVETDVGTFTGFVQWDSQECLYSDKLDGDSDDGRLSIAMGRIAAIERHRRSSSRVELADGRSLILDGTNDVDSSIRGIFVEDPRYGRVKVEWDSFERVRFQAAPSSGPAYTTFAASKPLHGTVDTRDGRRLTGRIVYDVDEEQSSEILQGNRSDVEYLIPFAMIRAIEPDGSHAAKVVLTSGEELRLEDSQDVSDDNDGILVFTGSGDPAYVSWDDLRRIEFDQ